jgi:hypothetical protein
MTYDISGIDRLSIRTTHTNIRLVRGNTDAITLTTNRSIGWTLCRCQRHNARVL